MGACDDGVHRLQGIFRDVGSRFACLAAIGAVLGAITALGITDHMQADSHAEMMVPDGEGRLQQGKQFMIRSGQDLHSRFPVQLPAFKNTHAKVVPIHGELTIRIGGECIAHLSGGCGQVPLSSILVTREGKDHDTRKDNRVVAVQYGLRGTVARG